MIEEIFKTDPEQMEDPNQLTDQTDIDVSRRELKRRRNLSPEDLDKAKNYTGWIPSGESKVREKLDPEDIDFGENNYDVVATVSVNIESESGPLTNDEIEEALNFILDNRNIRMAIGDDRKMVQARSYGVMLNR